MAGELGRRVGERIREARLEKGYGQRQLADLVADLTSNDAIDNQRISDWERGINQPNDANMRAIAQALDKPVAWFYSAQEKTAATPNLMGVMKNGDDQLDRIERKIDALVRFFAGLEDAEDHEARLAALRNLAAVAIEQAPDVETPAEPRAARPPQHRAG